MRKVVWFLRMELKIKEIGDRNRGSYGVFKFNHFTNAKTFSDKAKKPTLIILGDDGRYWVVSLGLGEKLVKAGYEIVE